MTLNLVCLGISINGQIPKTLMIIKVFKQVFMIELYLFLTVNQ